MTSPKIEQILKNLPTKPGVYLHKNEQDKVIYVGKAINLKSRVRSYFHKSAQNHAKTRRLAQEIADIEFIVTDSELEALLLENTLIKQYQPRYNVRLKDDKRYPYIKVHWSVMSRPNRRRFLISAATGLAGLSALIGLQHQQVTT